MSFVTLAWAACRRSSDRRWQYDLGSIRSLAFAIGALIVLPYAWWWFDYGGDNYHGGGANLALGCLIMPIPVVVAVALILGLALAKESAQPDV